MIPVLSAAIALGVMLWVVDIAVRSARGRRRIAERLLPQASSTMPARPESAPLRRSTTTENGGAITGWMERKIRRAGFSFGYSRILAVSLILGIALAAAAHRVFGLGWSVALAAMGGVTIPFVGISYWGARRARMLEEQLADTLDSIVGALQGGIGLQQALESVSQHPRKPVSEVISEVVSRTRLGASLPVALRGTARSIDSKPFDLFALSVTASYEAGGRLVPMLEGLSRRLRDTTRLKRRVRSLTAEARFSATILYLIPYGLAGFIWVHSPGNLLFLYRSPLGNTLIQAALLLQVVGLVWIVRLLRVRE